MQQFWKNTSKTVAWWTWSKTIAYETRFRAWSHLKTCCISNTWSQIGTVVVRCMLIWFKATCYSTRTINELTTYYSIKDKFFVDLSQFLLSRHLLSLNIVYDPESGHLINITKKIKLKGKGDARVWGLCGSDVSAETLSSLVLLPECAWRPDPLIFRCKRLHFQTLKRSALRVSKSWTLQIKNRQLRVWWFGAVSLPDQHNYWSHVHTSILPELTFLNGAHMRYAAQILWDTAKRLHRDTGFLQVAEIFEPTSGVWTWGACK